MPLVAAPEIGELAVFAVGVLALVLLFGTRTLALVLTGMLRFLPFVGGWVADHLMDHVVDGLSYAISWVVSSLGALVSVMWRPIAWFVQLVSDVIGAIAAAEGALHTLAFVTVPEVAFAAFGDAERALEGAVHYTDVRIGSVITWAGGEITGVEHWAGAELAQLATWTQGEVSGAIAWADGRINAVVSWAEGELGQLTGYVDGRINSVVTWTQGELSGLEQQIAADFAALAHSATTAIGAAERGLEGLIADAEARARDAANAVEAVALAEVATVARTLEDYLVKCGNPLCRNLTGLSNLLGLLEDAGGIALLVAFVAEAASDPRGVAGEVGELLAGPVEAFAGSIASLTGLAA